MKKLVTLFYVLAFSNIFSQTPAFEKCFEPIFNSGFNSISHDSSGYFYTVGSSYNGIDYSAPGIFMKLDRSGNFQFEKNFYFNDETYFKQILTAPDGNLIVFGNISGCDYGVSAGLVAKFTPAGDTLWVKSINTQPTGVTADNIFRSGTALHNGNILFNADSTIYALNNSSDSLFTIITSNPIFSVTDGLNENIIYGNQFGILVLDSAGLQINFVAFASPVTYLKLLPDSTYLVLSANTLFKIDTTYNILNQFDLTSLNFLVANIVVDSGKINLSNAQASNFAFFDLNLQLTDSFQMQLTDVIVNSFAISDSTIMVAGAEFSRNNHAYLKAYSTTGDHTYYSTDLALTDVSFDTTYVDQPSPLPSGVYRIKFVCRIIVQNTGTDTIHSFYINAESTISGPCGTGKYLKVIDNVNLAPGQSMSIPLDIINEYGIAISNFPYSYEFCPWLSCPNFKTDKDHSNDYLCDTAIFQAPTAIEEITGTDIVSIYPNPFDSEISIELKNEENLNSTYEIYDVLGEKKMSGKLMQKVKQIDFSEMPSGVYFLNIHTAKIIDSLKIIKL